MISVDWTPNESYSNSLDIFAKAIAVVGLIVAFGGILQSTMSFVFLGYAFIHAGFFIHNTQSKQVAEYLEEWPRQEILKQLDFDPKALPNTQVLNIRELTSGKFAVRIKEVQITDTVEDSLENVAKQRTSDTNSQTIKHITQNIENEDEIIESDRKGPFEGKLQIFTYCLILWLIGYVIYKGFIE